MNPHHKNSSSSPGELLFLPTPQLLPNWQGQAVPPLFSLSLEPYALGGCLMVKRLSHRGACCHAGCPRQPACCRAWQSSQIPWPGPQPQVHLHTSGAVMLLPAFLRVRPAKVWNKGETVTHFVCKRNANKVVLLLKQQNSAVYKEFLACPLTVFDPFSSYLLPGSAHAAPCPTNVASLIMPQRKKQEQNRSPPKPQHPVGSQICALAFWEQAW